METHFLFVKLIKKKKNPVPQTFFDQTSKVN